MEHREIMERWNDCLFRAESLAKQMAEKASNPDKRIPITSSGKVWGSVASSLKALRLKGNLLGQQKELSRKQQLDIASKFESKEVKRSEGREDSKKLIIEE